MSRRRVKKWAGLSLAELQKLFRRDSVFLYGAIDSTNDAAKDLAEAEEPAGTLVLCREQKAGRGRGERRWHSPPGSGLYLSEIFRPEAEALLPLVSLLAGLGVVRELDRRFPGLNPMLKWPNDVMVDDRKLGGILGESSWGETGPRYLVVGVGINVLSMEKTMTPRLRKVAAWIEEYEPDVQLSQVADAVVRGLEWRLSRPPVALEPAELDDLDAYDWLKNRRVRLQMAGGEDAIPGVCVGIAPDGALLFRPDRGALRRVTSGTIRVDEENRV
jgi:BirA family biotin operon repressor/biotin-[acetyl-CoA-carboxylase] ligase